MGKFTHLSQRGDIWWWRRRIRVFGHSVSLAFSLRTADTKRARVLRDRLDATCAEWTMAYGEQPSIMTADQAKEVFTDTLRWLYGRIMTDVEEHPDDVRGHIYLNEVFEVIHRILADQLEPEKAAYILEEEAEKRNWPWEVLFFAVKEINRMFAFNDVSGNQLSIYSEVFGIKPTPKNVERMKRYIRLARSRACVEANRRLKEDGDPHEGWVRDALANSDAPFAFQKANARTRSASPDGCRPQASSAAHAEPKHGAADQGTPSEARTPPAETGMSGSEPTAPSAAATGPTRGGQQAPPRPGLSAETLMTSLIALREKRNPETQARGWDDKSCRQAMQTAKLFDIVVGKDLKDVSTADVAFFADVLRHIPTRYSLSKPDHVAFIRKTAEALSQGSAPPPTSSGGAKTLSHATISRHLTFLNVLFARARLQGLTAEAIDVADVRKILPPAEKRKLGQPNDGSLVAQIFSLPIYTGCLPHDGSPGALTVNKRFEPGPYICHDAWYWVPLLLHYMGLRREEACKLTVDDVFDGPLPCIRIAFTPTGRVKSASSVRDLPLHPELVRLGFPAFAQACRKAGWTLLFPDLQRGKSSESLGDAFYDRVWLNIRKRCNLPKDFKPHGERHAFNTELFKQGVGLEDRARLSGHRTGVITADVYTKNNDLYRALEAIKKIPSVTDHLSPYPIQLNPTELRKTRTN